MQTLLAEAGETHGDRAVAVMIDNGFAEETVSPQKNRAKGALSPHPRRGAATETSRPCVRMSSHWAHPQDTSL